MRNIPEAIAALGTALQENRVDKHVQNAFDDLTSCLVLLNSSSPSVQMIRKLRSVLRRPLLSLYNACLQPALQLSCTVLSTVLGKLCDAHDLEDESFPEAWDATAEVILSGVLDFLDQKDGATVESDVVAWEALYRIICEFFFLGSGRGLPVFSIRLCLSAYNTLTEIAARQISIQNALRQRAVLGGERLGAAISGTRDFLLLEALLMLFARLLPPTHNTSQGKLGRFKFVKEVVGSPKLFKCSAELLDVMKNSGTHWDDVAAQIIDILAKCDITYPQPFSIDEIDLCGRVFPQPLATDRLIMDRQGLLANIVVENTDVCESLQVPYTHIRTITLDNSVTNVPKGKVLIIVYLTSPPLVANVAMESPGESYLHAKFLLQNDSLGRFMEALRRRGVGKLSFLNPPTRVERKRRSISIGSGFKFVNDSSPIPPTASFEGKVQHVNEVYKTDTEDPTTSYVVPASHGDHAISSPAPDLKPSFKDEKAVREALDPAAVEDVPTSRRNIALANVTSKSVPAFASPFFPENSTHFSGNNDELSEISEFEPDDNTAKATSLSTSPCNNGMTLSQHRSDRMQLNQHSHAASNGVNESSGPAPKTTGVTQTPPETGKPPPISHSPMFSSSSTQVDVSPKLLSNVNGTLTTTGIDVLEVYSASQNNVGTDMRRTLDVNKRILPDIITSAGETQMASSPERNEFRQHDKSFTTSISTGWKTRSRVEAAKDRNVPSKIAGTRRKREPVKPSGKHVVEVDDETAPPRKKSREDRHGIEGGNIRSKETSLGVVPTRKEKRSTKSANRSPPSVNPMTAAELGELKTICQGARRSSRIRKRQTAAIGGTRHNAIGGKTQKGKQADNQSAAISLQDSDVNTSRGTPLILSSRRIRESPPKLSGPVPSVEPGGFVVETNVPREMPKASNIVTCESNQPNVISAKEERENVIQGATSDAMQLIREQSDIRTDEIIDERHLVSEIRSADKVSQAQTVVECSVSPKKSEDSVETFRPTMGSTPLTETVTIDLTADDSPVQERSNQHKTSIDFTRSEANISMRLKTPDLSDCVAIEEPALVPSPRHRRRNVTFASPIEYVLERKAKSKTQVGSSSRRHPPPSENNTISPLRISTGTAERESSSRITPPVISKTFQGNPCSYGILTNSAHGHDETSAHDKATEEIGIEDIVDVLNEIQAAIIKGISDKFRNIKKGVQRDRDELVQQVLDELRAMVVENATYFNGLLRLEEDYHKNGKTITRCWEELIELNDSIAVQFQDALKEHVQNVSTRLFPRSLLPLQPIFPPRRA